MDRKTKRTVLLITFGVVLFVGLNHLGIVIAVLKQIAKLILPIILGLVFAFILNVPMNGIEKIISRIFKKSKHKPTGKLLHGISFLITIICIALVIVLAFTLAVPELVSSVKSIYYIIEHKWPEWMKLLSDLNIDTTYISGLFAELDLRHIIETATSSASTVLSSVAGVAASTISGVTSTLFALVISIYVLLDKDDLSRQTKKALYAYLNDKTANKICYISVRTRNVFSKFLSGQCVEAIILGVLIFIAFSIFRLPHANLIAFLTGIFAFIPYIGAFSACLIGAFLTLLSSPSQVLVCVIVFLCVQFIENQFIYPHVVGGSVGLSPFWTLIAALTGANLLGLAGMIFFIPLTAVIYSLLKEYTNKKIEAKHITASDNSENTPPTDT